jgi:hypothetical protein
MFLRFMMPLLNLYAYKKWPRHSFLEARWLHGATPKKIVASLFKMEIFKLGQLPQN